MISVVMPTYNRGYIIQRALESILNQTYQEYEIIVVDDGSTDNTSEIMEQYNKAQIKYVKCEVNHGANHARNVGMAMAQGEYIAFLDSDNEWMSEFLETRVHAMERDSELMLVFGRTEVDFLSKRIVPKEEKSVLNDYDKIKRILLLKNVIDTNTVCIRRTCIAEFGKFDEQLPRLQDWDYFSRIVYQCKGHYLFEDDVRVKNHILNDSISNQKENYWKARACIFKKNVERYREQEVLGVVADDIGRLLNGYPEEKKAKFLEDIFSCLTYEEIAQFVLEMCKGQQEGSKKNVEKNQMILNIESAWIENLLRGKRIAGRYMTKNIAIYGYGELGKLLYKQLQKADIHVECIIDKYVSEIQSPLLVHTYPKSDNIDVIIITPILWIDEIKGELQEKSSAELISITDFIDMME